jgi:hypothetical protein
MFDMIRHADARQPLLLFSVIIITLTLSIIIFRCALMISSTPAIAASIRHIIAAITPFPLPFHFFRLLPDYFRHALLMRADVFRFISLF